MRSFTQSLAKPVLVVLCAGVLTAAGAIALNARSAVPFEASVTVKTPGPQVMSPSEAVAIFQDDSVIRNAVAAARLTGVAPDSLVHDHLQFQPIPGAPLLRIIVTLPSADQAAQLGPALLPAANAKMAANHAAQAAARQSETDAALRAAADSLAEAARAASRVKDDSSRRNEDAVANASALEQRQLDYEAARRTYSQLKELALNERFNSVPPDSFELISAMPPQNVGKSMSQLAVFGFLAGSVAAALLLGVGYYLGSLLSPSQ